MSYKSFFSIVALVLIVITEYFVGQLNSSQEITCWPNFDFKCDAYAQLACEGDEYLAQIKGSWCNGSTCRSCYEIWCDVGMQMEKQGAIFCNNEDGCSGVN